jgi:hypothetical protein
MTPRLDLEPGFFYKNDLNALLLTGFLRGEALIVLQFFVFDKGCNL